MGAHIFKAGRCQCCSNFIRACDPLWSGQVCIEVAVYQNLGPSGPPADGRNDVLYGRGILRDKVTPHNMQRCLPVIIWKTKMFGMWRQSTYKEKFPALQ